MEIFHFLFFFDQTDYVNRKYASLVTITNTYLLIILFFPSSIFNEENVDHSTSIRISMVNIFILKIRIQNLRENDKDERNNNHFGRSISNIHVKTRFFSFLHLFSAHKREKGFDYLFLFIFNSPWSLI